MTTEEPSAQIGTGKYPFIELLRAGDIYVREIIGFHDIMSEISTDRSDAIARWMEHNAPLMSPDALAALPEVFRQAGTGMAKAADHLEKSEAGEVIGGFTPINIEIPGQEVGDILSMFVSESFRRGLVDRTKLVGRAFIIAAESSFEVLLAQAARAIYQRNPSALPKSDYTFTLEELSQYSSIDEAREALITRRIEALLMESVDGWSKWLDRTVNLTFSGVVGDWPILREVFARRNVLVHAGGKVTRRYVQDLSNSSIDVTGLEVGQELEISKAYLEGALERLAAFGILLTFRVWSKLYKSNLDESAEWVSSNQDFLTRHQMWLASELISHHFQSVACRRSVTLAIQINGWLARKRSRGIENIEAEVTEWDVSGLANNYKMAKSLLLNKIEDAQREVSREMENGRLSRFEVASNDLFAEYRQYVDQQQEASSGQSEAPTNIEPPGAGQTEETTL